MQWFRKSADQGNSSAQNGIGVLYKSGRGVEQNYDQAAIWYRRAADGGNAIAQLNLAGMYQTGMGVPQDDLQTYIWYSIAVDRFSTSETQYRDTAINNRDKVAKILTSKQIEQAQKLVMNWKPTLQKPSTSSPQKQQANTNPVPASKYVGPRTASAVDPKQIEITFWQTIQNSTDAADFQDYLQQYPKGSFASLARRKVTSLQKRAPSPQTARQ